MQEPKAWDGLIWTLIEICEPLLKRAATAPEEHVPVQIIDALFLRALIRSVLVLLL
jgi:hypothetical protein